MEQCASAVCGLENYAPALQNTMVVTGVDMERGIPNVPRHSLVGFGAPVHNVLLSSLDLLCVRGPGSDQAGVDLLETISRTSCISLWLVLALPCDVVLQCSVEHLCATRHRLRP